MRNSIAKLFNGKLTLMSNFGISKKLMMEFINPSLFLILNDHIFLKTNFFGHYNLILNYEYKILLLNEKYISDDLYNLSLNEQ